MLVYSCKPATVLDSDMNPSPDLYNRTRKMRKMRKLIYVIDPNEAMDVTCPFDRYVTLITLQVNYAAEKSALLFLMAK
jgi:hypothetical protein